MTPKTGRDTVVKYLDSNTAAVQREQCSGAEATPVAPRTSARASAFTAPARGAPPAAVHMHACLERCRVFAVPLAANRAALRNRRGMDRHAAWRAHRVCGPSKASFEKMRMCQMQVLPGPLLAEALVSSHVCRVNVAVNNLLAM